MDALGPPPGLMSTRVFSSHFHSFGVNRRPITRIDCIKHRFKFGRLSGTRHCILMAVFYLTDAEICSIKQCEPSNWMIHQILCTCGCFLSILNTIRRSGLNSFCEKMRVVHCAAPLWWILVFMLYFFCMYGSKQVCSTLMDCFCSTYSWSQTERQHFKMKSMFPTFQ